MRSPSLAQTVLQPLLQLRPALAALPLEALARQTGFLRRHPRKIPVLDLLVGLCAAANESVLSLERLAAVIGLAANGSYSKQALHQRLGPALPAFLATVAVALFDRLAAPCRAHGGFAGFGRVLLHDSTVQSLPRHLAAAFPGGASQHTPTTAALKIQWVCDLLSGAVVQLSLSSFRRNDQACAPDILRVVQQGDLLLRDLGFFNLAVLAQVAAAGAFFLSRLRSGVVLRDPQTRLVIDLLQVLRHTGAFDGWVLVGETEHRMRVVALPVPLAVAQRRRCAARHNRDRRCVPTQRRLALMHWSLFVTNVDPAVWPAAVVAEIYRLRWRIETTFKAWKSHLRLRELNCHSADLVGLSVLLKLLYGLLTTRCFDALARRENPGGQVSLLRLARALGRAGPLLTAAILHIRPQAVLAHYLEKHIFYEHRADRKNFCQHLAELAGGLA
jgi:hypothetical protein